MIYNRIDDADAERIARWPHASRLQVLMLQGNPLGEDGLRTLLDSPNLEKLRAIGASDVGEPLEKRITQRFGDNAMLR
jgi:hypothetical protein